MKIARLSDVALHYRVDGPAEGPTVVFANSLGTDLRLWDAVLPYLPEGLRLIRFDKRGHGLSSCPDAPYSMGALIRDTEELLDLLERLLALNLTTLEQRRERERGDLITIMKGMEDLDRDDLGHKKHKAT